MHGFKQGHTRTARSEMQRNCMIGNTFSCIVVAHFLCAWARDAGYVAKLETPQQLWRNAGYSVLEPCEKQPEYMMEEDHSVEYGLGDGHEEKKQKPLQPYGQPTSHRFRRH